MVGYQAKLADNIPARSIQNIGDFGAMIPLRDASMLPEDRSAFCVNAYTYGGVVEGFRTRSPVYRCQKDTTKQVYRLGNLGADQIGLQNTVFLEFDDPFISVVRNPVAEDSFNRYYFFSSLAGVKPTYNTLARILTNQPAFVLGVPAPRQRPTVTISGGKSTVLETRSYVYTFQSEYGEEGPPSNFAIGTGPVDATWKVHITSPDPANHVGQNITYINIYRTVTDVNGNAAYYQIRQLPFGPHIYVDPYDDATVAQFQQLPSATWTPPPKDLQGVVALSNGMLAGFSNNREVWFCEPYRPHAWPGGYAVTVDNDIVGLAAVGTSVVVLTRGKPWFFTGATPATMTGSIIQSHEPCIARGSIVPAAEGVYYASSNGLMLITPMNVQNVVKGLIAKRQWLPTDPYNSAAARYGTAYVSFSKGDANLNPDKLTPGVRANGFLLDDAVPNVSYTWLDFGGIVTNVYFDNVTGGIFVLSGGLLYEWNPEIEEGSLPWVWRSKEFRLPFAQDYVGGIVYFDVPPFVGFTPSSYNTDQNQTYNPATQYMIIRVWADGRPVLVREIQRSGEIFLLPGGYKATYYQFQIEGIVKLKGVKLGTSIKELQLG